MFFKSIVLCFLKALFFPVLILAGCSGSSSKDVTPGAVDTVKPVLTGTLVLGATYNSLALSPNMTWKEATDNSGNIDYYMISVGTQPGTQDVLNWTSISGSLTSCQISGLNLLDLSTYYPTLKAVDKSGNESITLMGSGWLVDLNGPIVNVTGLPTGPSQTTNLTATVSGSLITQYKYKLGLSDSTDCSNAVGYSSDIYVQSGFNLSIDSIVSGTIKACFIGKNTLNNYQSFASASVYSWTKVAVTSVLSYQSEIQPNDVDIGALVYPCNADITVTSASFVTHYKSALIN